MPRADLEIVTFAETRSAVRADAHIKQMSEEARWVKS